MPEVASKQETLTGEETLALTKAPSPITISTSISNPPTINSFIEKNYQGLYINEIMPNPIGDDKKNEWIELYNSTLEPIDLSGFLLLDKSGEAFLIPQGKIIQPKSFLVFYSSETKISLNNSGDSLKLFSSALADKVLISEINYFSSKENYSFSRDKNNNFVETKNKTPGLANIINIEKDSGEAKNNIFQENNQVTNTLNISKVDSAIFEQKAAVIDSLDLKNYIVDSPITLGVIILSIIIIVTIFFSIKTGLF